MARCCPFHPHVGSPCPVTQPLRGAAVEFDPETDLPQDDEQAGFSSRTAAALAGITYRQLDYWCRTDLASPSLADATGSGSRRRFSMEDVILLAVLAYLVHRTHPGSGPTSRTVLHRIAGLVQEAPEGLLFVASDGSACWTDLPANQECCLMVDVAAIATRVREASQAMAVTR